MAISRIAQAIIREPENLEYKRLFTHWIRGKAVQGSTSNTFEQALILCLKDKSLLRQPLFIAWFAALQRKSSLESFLKAQTYEDFLQTAEPESFREAIKDSLFLAGLPALYSTSPALERVLTYIRHFCLEQVNAFAPNDLLPFLSALGLHCFQNEYVFLIRNRENELLLRLKEVIENSNFEVDQDLVMTALYSCYKPLISLANAGALRDISIAGAKDPLFQELIARQVEEPMAEAKLRGKIPALTPVKSAVSQAVRRQYEENPYPRWHSWQNLRPENRDAGIGKSILNAGCGTGQSPISTATLYPGARVTGIDLSLSSLAYAQRKADEMELGNIRFAQADILELDSWEERFDLIMSGGVLHHLENPLEGWRVLTDLLKPDGVMSIALYSERGRQSVVQAQEWIKEQNIPSDDDGIRAFREHIFNCNPSDPLKKITHMFDFYTLSNCRDLAFHVMEHRFTCLEIRAMLEELDLKFLGFQNLPPNIVLKYSEMFPDDHEQNNLENWDRLEQQNPLMFVNMYKFWCCRRSERPHNNLPVWLESGSG